MLCFKGLRSFGRALSRNNIQLDLSGKVSRQFSSHSQSRSFASTDFKSGRHIGLINHRPCMHKRTSASRIVAAARFNSTNATASSPPPPVLPTHLDGADGITRDLASIPEHIGYLKEIGIDYGWGPTSMVQWLLEHVHIWTGSPWWLSIVLTAFVIRVIMFKPYINASNTAAKMHELKPLTEPMTEKMREASKSNDQVQLLLARQQLSKLYRDHKLNPMAAFVPLIQIPLGYGSFRLMRGMAELPVPGLETGGVAWFTDLTASDPLYILPVATCLILHFTLKWGGELGSSAAMSPGLMRLMAYGMPALMLFFTLGLPSGLQLTFLFTAILGMIQSRAFRQPTIRRILGMTPLPSRPPVLPWGQKVESNSITATPRYQAPGAANPTKKGLVGNIVASVREEIDEGKKKLDKYTKNSEPWKRTEQEKRKASEYERMRKEEMKNERRKY